jgi:hypothetical protein
LSKTKLGKSNVELQQQLEIIDSESDLEENLIKIKNSKFLDLTNDLRIELLMEEFWNMLKDWATNYTPISTFKNWENRLKIRLHNFPVGQNLILEIDSDEMLDSSSTVFDYLKLLFKYIKPFKIIRNKIDKKILSWRANKNGMMRMILDLPYQKCDFFRVKKIVDTKLQQDDELGVDLSGMAPENRKICMSALFNKNKKRPNNNAYNANNTNNANNANNHNPNNPNYSGGNKFKKSKKKFVKKPNNR